MGISNCPFCGGGNLRQGTRDGIGYVDCKHCHITVYFWRSRTAADAEERWNRRASNESCPRTSPPRVPPSHGDGPA
jgi:Lar family restriction alleviation protein